MFKMKVLVVCLLAATAFFGMGASTPLEKVEGETNVEVERETNAAIFSEDEEAFTSMDVEVLKGGPGK